VEVWQTSTLRPLRLGEEEKERKKIEEETTGQKYVRFCYAGRPLQALKGETEQTYERLRKKCSKLCKTVRMDIA